MNKTKSRLIGVDKTNTEAGVRVAAAPEGKCSSRWPAAALGSPQGNPHQEARPQRRAVPQSSCSHLPIFAHPGCSAGPPALSPLCPANFCSRPGSDSECQPSRRPSSHPVCSRHQPNALPPALSQSIFPPKLENALKAGVVQQGITNA